ncbi:MAG: hypothetical protein JO316_00220 [Abitibacteriaceae bacterium]|nr:hypothetical protein [Abditibacteriaceae bacterium]
MKSWKQALINSLLIGKMAGVTTAVAAAVCGQVENGSAIAPINAISHIVHGDKAAQNHELSLKYTMTGLALNSAANSIWAALYEIGFGEAAEQGNVPVSLLGGAIISSVAYITDYHLVPPRFTPGFEKHLSSRSLFIIYAVLALSLVIGGLLRRKK